MTRHCVAALAGVVLFAGSLRADPSQATLTAADRMIKADGKLILNWAYPSAKRLDKHDYDKWTTTFNGFELYYTLSYTDSDGDAAYVSLRFEFDNNGRLLKLAETARSSFWPAFGTAQLLLGAFQEAIRNDAKLKNDPNWQKLLTVREPTEFLTGYMNLRSGK